MRFTGPHGHTIGRGELALVLAALLWGTTFVTVKGALDDVDPIPFLALRFCVGAAVMGVVAVRGARRAVAATSGLPPRASPWLPGLCAGAALSAGYLFQTFGLENTTPPVSAFITYLLVVIVPLLESILLRRVPSGAVSAGATVSAIGLVLLTGVGSATVGGVGRGELLTLGCAFAFAAHILVLARVVPRCEPVALTAVQLGVVGVGCLVPGLFWGGYAIPLRAWLAIVYCGAAASALAFFLQVYGQTRVAPARAALILVLEPVFAALLGLARGDEFTAAMTVGAVLILIGVLLASRPSAQSPRLKVDVLNAGGDVRSTSRRGAPEERAKMRHG